MAILSINDGLFIGAPVLKTITYTDGNSGEAVSADVYIKPFGIAQSRRFMAAYNGNDDAKADKDMAQTIADAVVDEQGKPLFKRDDVLRLKQDLVFALLSAIGEVNNPKQAAN